LSAWAQQSFDLIAVEVADHAEGAKSAAARQAAADRRNRTPFCISSLLKVFFGFGQIVSLGSARPAGEEMNDEHGQRQHKNEMYKEAGYMEGEQRQSPTYHEQYGQNSKHEVSPSI
jgi:hypothetical protein